MTAEIEEILLLVTSGHPGDGTLYLRFSPEHRVELLSLIEDEGIHHGTVMEFSAEADLAIEAVKVLGPAGGLLALSSIIKTFVQQHNGKRVVLKQGEFEVEAAGFSAKKTEQFLQRAATAQAEVDAKWRAMDEQMRLDERTD
jgi:hypothetical protein